MQVVGLAFERSVDWLVALLGVLLSGRAYVPLDLSPTSRAVFPDAVDDTAMRIMLAGAECRDVFAGLAQEYGKGDKRKKGRVTVLTLDDVSRALGNEGGGGDGVWGGSGEEGAEKREKMLRALLPRVKASSVCCVLYTLQAESGMQTLFERTWYIMAR